MSPCLMMGGAACCELAVSVDSWPGGGVPVAGPSVTEPSTGCFLQPLGGGEGFPGDLGVWVVVSKDPLAGSEGLPVHRDRFIESLRMLRSKAGWQPVC
jgi:hypothetical protein